MGVENPLAHFPRTDRSILKEGFPIMFPEIGDSESSTVWTRENCLRLAGAAGRLVIIVNLTKIPPVNSEPLVLASDDLFAHDVAPPIHRDGQYRPPLHRGRILVGVFNVTLDPSPPDLIT